MTAQHKWGHHWRRFVTSGRRLRPRGRAFPLLRGLQAPLLARRGRLPPTPLLVAQPPPRVLLSAWPHPKLLCGPSIPIQDDPMRCCNTSRPHARALTQAGAGVYALRQLYSSYGCVGALAAEQVVGRTTQPTTWQGRPTCWDRALRAPSLQAAQGRCWGQPACCARLLHSPGPLAPQWSLWLCALMDLPQAGQCPADDMPHYPQNPQQDVKYLGKALTGSSDFGQGDKFDSTQLTPVAGSVDEVFRYGTLDQAACVKPCEAQRVKAAQYGH